MPSPVHTVCSGCGYAVAGGELPPFRCPRARPGDGIDHVLARCLDPAALAPAGDPRALFLDPEPLTFLRYRRLLGSYHYALAHGLGDGAFEDLVRELDGAVSGIDGAGFHCTPYGERPELARELGIGALAVKDETGNVSGSHKGRHLFGVLLWLEIAGRTAVAGAPAPDARLAIASCGNAALAAAVVARAAGRRLSVYVPSDADPAVVERLVALEARIETCHRRPGVAGDPCYHAFHRALAEGALPFTCQGPDNGLIFEGGATLGWEIASSLASSAAGLDRLFVQVGGGALATSLVLGLREARDLGVLKALPRIQAVQTGGGYPLWRAWDRLVAGLLEESPAGDPEPARDGARAARVAALPRHRLELATQRAALRRADFMWPWESAPRSIATGILDDETYDWLAVVRGMLETGGHPLVVADDRIAAATALATRRTGRPVGPTGAAGLAGCLELAERGLLEADERVAVVLTGIRRSR